MKILKKLHRIRIELAIDAVVAHNRAINREPLLNELIKSATSPSDGSLMTSKIVFVGDTCIDLSDLHKIKLIQYKF